MNTNKEAKPKKEKSKARKIIEWVLTGIVVALFLVLGIGQIQGMATKGDNYNNVLPYGFGNFVVQTDSMEPEYKVGTAIVTHKDSAESIYQLYLENQEYNKPIYEEYSTKYDAALTQEDKISIILEMESKTKNIDMTFMDVYASYSQIKVENTYNNPIVKGLNNPVQSTAVMTHRLREIQYHPEVEEGKGRYIFITSGTNIGGHYSAFGQYQAFTEKEILGVVRINSHFLGGFFKFVSSIWGLLILLLIPALYLVITSILDIFKAMKDDDEEPEKSTIQGVIDSSKKSSSDSNDVLSGISKEDQERLKAEMMEEMLSKQQNNMTDNTKKEDNKKDHNQSC